MVHCDNICVCLTTTGSRSVTGQYLLVVVVVSWPRASEVNTGRRGGRVLVASNVAKMKSNPRPARHPRGPRYSRTTPAGLARPTAPPRPSPTLLRLISVMQMIRAGLGWHTVSRPLRQVWRGGEECGRAGSWPGLGVTERIRGGVAWRGRLHRERIRPAICLHSARAAVAGPVPPSAPSAPSRWAPKRGYCLQAVCRGGGKKVKKN